MSTMLRIAYATVMSTAVAFVTVGPYGSWPMIDIDHWTATPMQTERPATPAAAAARSEQPDCAGAECTGAAATVVTAISPAATVIETAAQVRAATIQLEQPVSAGIVAHTAATEPFLQAAKPAAKPIDTTHAEQQKHALIAARAKEPRTRTANEKPAGEKPVAHKPRSDSDWASRLVFNRGG